MPLSALLLASQIAIHGAPAGLSPALRTVFHAADVVTAISYFVIAATLTVIVFRLKRHLPFQIVFVLFGLFIVFCGATHVMGILPLGEYRGAIETSTMVATAAVSLLTAIVFPTFVPRIEALVRDAQLARQREREQARADALAESNTLLESQAADLQRANALLAESLRERERIEAHLRQVQKMELMGRLASGVAHDFNNLLTVIHGNIELTRGAIEDRASPLPFLEEVEFATNHATELTRRLLAFSRKGPSRTERTSLDDLLARERRLLQRALPSDMQLELRTGTSGSLVEVDVTQMQQAVLNLIVNARDAITSTGRGAGRVTIETGQVQVEPSETPTSPPIRPGTYITLSVQDEGTGMTEDVRSHIFEPFFTTKAEGHGTGLGLAMVYDVMVQSGGGVKVESTVGRGTTFTLMLPRVA